MRYGDSKLKKPEETRFLWYFYHINRVKSKYKGLKIEKKYWKLLHIIYKVLQTTLGGNPTCSFRDI